MFPSECFYCTFSNINIGICIGREGDISVNDFALILSTAFRSTSAGVNSPTVSAWHALLRSVMDQPLRGASLNNLAHHHWLADEPAEALVWARWATDSRVWGAEGVDPRAWRNLGNVLLDHGRYREAEQSFRLADPDLKDCQVQGLASPGGPGEWMVRSHAEAFQATPLPTGALRPPHWLGWPDGSSSRSGMSRLRGFDSVFSLVAFIVEGLIGGFEGLPDGAPPWCGCSSTASWLGPQLSVVERDSSPQSTCHGSLLSLPWLLQLLGEAPLRHCPLNPAARVTTSAFSKAARLV